MPPKRIPSEVAEKMGYYVYAYLRRSDGKILYVGKGKGQRALAHLTSARHQVDVLAHGLPSEEVAFKIEASLIDALHPPLNRVRGKHSATFARVELQELITRLAAIPVEIRDPSILIRINQLHRPRMTPRQLYEVTRGVWALGKRRETVKYAMPVFHGVIREVYRILSWHAAGSTSYTYRTRTDVSVPGRWEFRGRVADPGVRERYILRSVEHLFPSGSQNPVKYVP